MTVQAIRTALIQQNVLTTTDSERLNRIHENLPFLEAVLAIFEEKAGLYLDLGGEHAIQNAYRAFYKHDKISVLPSLHATLSRAMPPLLRSLGLSKVGENGDNLAAIERRIFIAFTARYRLVQTVDREALKTLLENIENPPFPMYLFDSLRREYDLACEIRRTCHASSAQVVANRLAETYTERLPEMYIITQGIVNYCAITAFATEMPQSFRPRYFNHMQSTQARAEFTDLVSRCYLREMSNSARHLEQMQQTNQRLQEQERFLPALSLLDMQIGVDTAEIERQLAQINQAVEANRQRGASYEQELQTAQRNAHARIAEWRASIPERPITYGVQIGFKL